MTIICLDFATKRLSTMDGVPTEAVVPTPIGDDILTSHPYPIEVFEELSGGVAWRNGYLFPMPIDSLDISARVLTGELITTTGYVELTPFEALDMTATVVEGELTVTTSYGSFDYSEALDMTATVVSGELRMVMVSTSLEDSLDMSATVVGGTLS